MAFLRDFSIAAFCLIHIVNGMLTVETTQLPDVYHIDSQEIYDEGYGDGYADGVDDGENYQNAVEYSEKLDSYNPFE